MIEVHVTRLKFYHDELLDTEAIMSNVVTSETGMTAHRVMKLVDIEDGIKVRIRWHGLAESKDTLAQVYQDVPQLLLKLLLRPKNNHVNLTDKARRELHF